MSKLIQCPFCGENAEMHRKKSSITYYVDEKSKIPQNGTFEKEIRFKDGVVRFEYSVMDFIPRCISTLCVGRTTKTFKTEEEATQAWNRRTPNE